MTGTGTVAALSLESSCLSQRSSTRPAAGEAVTQETSGLSKREWAELMAVLDRKA